MGFGSGFCKGYRFRYWWEWRLKTGIFIIMHIFADAFVSFNNTFGVSFDLIAEL